MKEIYLKYFTCPNTDDLECTCRLEEPCHYKKATDSVLEYAESFYGDIEGRYNDSKLDMTEDNV